MAGMIQLVFLPKAGKNEVFQDPNVAVGWQAI